jgi:hypothetical protein
MSLKMPNRSPPSASVRAMFIRSIILTSCSLALSGMVGPPGGPENRAHSCRLSADM